ncbi:hypothetical protein T439DRAFT_360367 [Meredithblackwellia eburnea MCA 4105]
MPSPTLSDEERDSNTPHLRPPSAMSDRSDSSADSTFLIKNRAPGLHDDSSLDDDVLSPARPKSASSVPRPPGPQNPTLSDSAERDVSDSSSGLGMTQQENPTVPVNTKPFTKREIQTLLDDGFLRDFMDVYCKYMGIELIKGEYRATVVTKHWGKTEVPYIPCVIIDGPGGVDPEDLQDPPDQESPFVPRCYPLPVKKQLMWNLFSTFSFPSSGTNWVAEDISNTSEVFVIHPADGPDAKRCCFTVQFGDCNELSPDQRKSVSDVLESFLEKLASYLGGKLIGTWQDDWDHVWITSYPRVVLIGPGINCGGGDIRVDADPTFQDFQLNVRAFSFKIPHGSSGNGSNSRASSDFSHLLPAEALPFSFYHPLKGVHPFKEMKSTRLRGWNILNTGLQLPPGFMGPTKWLKHHSLCVQLLLRNDSHRVGFKSERMGSYENSLYVY